MDSAQQQPQPPSPDAPVGALCPFISWHADLASALAQQVEQIAFAMGRAESPYTPGEAVDAPSGAYLPDMIEIYLASSARLDAALSLLALTIRHNEDRAARVAQENSHG